ncbi:MAG: UDP-N-acetylmuramate--L-alanine ligase [Candidatus Omnitrophica bacterium]|nr:UDP-N-acetylmuramate--L-alanine ligase [Candidatus Omnitrophota bacterium]
MHYHLIGIGGIGMSGIAKLLLGQGRRVSGSDLKESKLTRELEIMGASIFIGHHPLNIKGADLVIYSSAIKEGNPEMQAAKRGGLPLVKRAQALAQLMKEQAVITITGSHGKTTTASLISCLLLEAGLSPTVAVGGILRNIANNASMGAGKFFVAEADESDGSFLYYTPRYSIITNIDREHLDYYKDFAGAISAFKEFIHKTEPGGCVFCCYDDANLRDILKGYKGRSVLFGLSDNADIRAGNIEINGLVSEFDCFYRGESIGRFRLNLGGSHNISNALSVIALGLELKINPAVIKNALANYQGACRRMEIKFQDKDYLVLDDYAHHPTEIKATLAAVSNLKRRIIAVFQPHRYTRTKLLLDEFGRCFALADYLIVTDIYSASEPPLAGVSAKLLYDKIKEYSPDKPLALLPKEEIVRGILKIIEPGDLVVTLGAGDITRTCDELADTLKKSAPVPR